MNFHRLTELIEQGEGLNVEFKRKVSSPERIAKEMIAFANTSGGVIIFGIDDDKHTYGVESEKGEIEFISSATEYIDPPLPINISIFNIENKDIICVEIEESKNKPHFLIRTESNGKNDGPRAYIRVGENSVLASREMVKILKHQYGKENPVKLIVGVAEKRLFVYFEDHDSITVRDYAKLINVSERRASRLLVRLVRSGTLAIHTMEKYDYFTLMHEET